MADDRFDKTSWEEYPIDVDFSNKLPATAASITTATYSAIKYPWDDPDTTSSDDTIFADTNATIVEDVKARVTVQGGTSGYGYDILCKATLNDDSQVEHEVTMKVEDNQ